MKTLNQLIRYLATPRGLNSFYGPILQQAQQQIRPDLPAPAAVSVTPLGVWQLLWNPEKLDSTPLNYQLLVLIHEAAHLSLNHLSRGLRLLRSYRETEQYYLKRKQFLVAADLAVNSLVIEHLLNRNPLFENLSEEIPQRWLFPELFDFPEKESLETYFRLLENETEEQTQLLLKIRLLPPPGTCSPPSPEGVLSDGNPDGDTETSSEESYGPGEDVQVDDILKQPDSTISQTIRTTEQEAKHRLERCRDITQRNRGTTPHYLQKELDYLDAEAEVDWFTVLRDYTKTVLNEKIAECVASPNVGLLHLSDYGCEPYPGFSLDTTLSIAVLVDSSGSISTEQDYKPFLRELAGLFEAHQGLLIHYIVFDVGVHEELLFTSEGRDDLLKHRLNVRPASGGTCFLAPFRCALGVATEKDYGAKCERTSPLTTTKPDLIIIMTDGYAEFESPRGPYPEYLNDGVPNIWVLTKNHTNLQENLNKMQRIIEL